MYISSLLIVIGVISCYCVNDTNSVFLSFICMCVVYSLFALAFEKHVNRK
jgi:hypothetical protein